MANVVAMTGRAAMTELARWLRAGVLVACIGQRMAALFTRRVCAAWWSSVRALPPVLLAVSTKNWSSASQRSVLTVLP